MVLEAHKEAIITLSSKLLDCYDQIGWRSRRHGWAYLLFIIYNYVMV